MENDYGLWFSFGVTLALSLIVILAIVWLILEARDKHK